MQSIARCLADPRVDLAVSEWLSHKFNHRENLPPEVMDAYRADRYLVEVNSGGHIGFFRWEFDAVPATVGSLAALDLPRHADALKAAMHLVNPGQWPESRNAFDEAAEAFDRDESRTALMEQLDELIMGASKAIEGATHSYIRKHLANFQSLDD